MADIDQGVERPGQLVDTLTAVEQQILRHNIADRGGWIYHNRAGGTFEAVGRYLTEGGRLLPARNWRLVMRCVIELLEREPELARQVTSPPLTASQVEEQRRIRREQADALLVEAGEAYCGNEFTEAFRLVDEAELAAPEHTPNHRTYDDLRAFLVDERASRRAAVRPLKSAHSCRRCGYWLEGDWSAADARGRAELQRQMAVGRCDNCTDRELLAGQSG